MSVLSGYYVEFWSMTKHKHSTTVWRVKDFYLIA